MLTSLLPTSLRRTPSTLSYIRIAVPPQLLITPRSFSISAITMSSQRIKVGSASAVPVGKMKEVTFSGEGDDAIKVLLSNVGGKIHATSAKCTHYGAPLANGVLTGDGRIICPWHGACFKAATGDIEDAPALDSLLSLQCEVEGDDVFVTAKADDLKGKPGVAPSCKGGASSVKKDSKGVVFVGGGAGTIHSVEALRKDGYLGPITILSAEPYAPIDRTKLSKALLADADKVLWRTKAHLSKVLGVDLRENVRVSSVDVKSKSVSIEGGSKVEYDQLVLATGGTPKRLPVKGNDLRNVLVLRTIQDTQAINEAIGNPDGEDGKKKNLVIVGTNFIGMEAAIASAKRANVTVVGMESVPFEKVLGKQVGQGLMKAQEKNGLRFHNSASVSHFEPSSSDSSAIGAVVIKDSSDKEIKLPADVVILGVGVGPATQFLKEAPGFPALQKDGGVEVDEHFRVKGLAQDANVFAIGDIAAYPTRNGGVGRIEHWNVAGNQGRAVGQTIAGNAQKFDKVPIFWSALGSQLRYCGSGGPQFEDVYIYGNPEELKFAAYYTHGDEVVAVATMGVDPLMVQSSELMRIGKMPKASEIKSGKDPLSIDLSSFSQANM